MIQGHWSPIYNGRKVHFFISDHRTLCGKDYVTRRKLWMVEDRCTTCLKKLVKAGANEAQQLGRV